jgi:hypothetical protein
MWSIIGLHWSPQSRSLFANIRNYRSAFLHFQQGVEKNHTKIRCP